MTVTDCPQDTFKTFTGQFKDTLVGLLNKFKRLSTLSSSVLHDRDIDRDITEKKAQLRRYGY